MAREERVCKECGSGKVKDVEHWLLRCEALKTLREPLLAEVQEYQEGDHGNSLCPTHVGIVKVHLYYNLGYVTCKV